MMISISDTQLDAIEGDLWRTRIEELAISMRRQFPSHLEPLTEAAEHSATEALVQHGMSLGFEHDDEVESWLEFSVVFGARAETDASMAWFGATVRDTAFANTTDKLDFLDNSVRLYSRDIFGDQYGSVPKEAFERWSALMARQLVSSGDAEDPATLLLKIWPEKAAACEPEDLDRFLHSARNTAADYGFNEPWAWPRFALAAFMLGHRFDIDPLYPRLKDTLAVSRYDQQMRLFNLEQQILSDVVNPRLAWIRSLGGE